MSDSVFIKGSEGPVPVNPVRPIGATTETLSTDGTTPTVATSIPTAKPIDKDNRDKLKPAQVTEPKAHKPTPHTREKVKRDMSREPGFLFREDLHNEIAKLLGDAGAIKISHGVAILTGNLAHGQIQDLLDKARVSSHEVILDDGALKVVQA